MSALRVDARRNREKLLAAATAAFAERGMDASLEDIARQAGVGVGTLYRHFPTRHALAEAVYRQGVEQLCGAARRLLAELGPADALAEWMQDFVGYVARKRGMAAALKATVGIDSDVFVQSHAMIAEAVGDLVGAAQQDGAIRSDVEPLDLLRALSGICLANDEQALAGRLVGLLMDGLRYGAPASAPASASRVE